MRAVVGVGGQETQRARIEEALARALREIGPDEFQRAVRAVIERLLAEEEVAAIFKHEVEEVAWRVLGNWAMDRLAGSLVGRLLTDERIKDVAGLAAKRLEDMLRDKVESLSLWEIRERVKEQVPKVVRERVEVELKPLLEELRPKLEEWAREAVKELLEGERSEVFRQELTATYRAVMDRLDFLVGQVKSLEERIYALEREVGELRARLGTYLR